MEVRAGKWVKRGRKLDEREAEREGRKERGERGVDARKTGR